jgi:F-type H+-transporting ATPase subunit delta
MSLAVANRYSRALAEVVFAPNSGLTAEQALAEVGALADAVGGSPELAAVLRSPAVALAHKRNLLGKICDKIGVSKTIRNLSFVLADHGRTTIVKEIRQAFEALVDERRGVARAEIAVAAEASPAQKASLEAALARLTGKQVVAAYSVNPSLIGGATARVGSTIYDGSIRGQLAAIGRKLNQA